MNFRPFVCCYSYAKSFVLMILSWKCIFSLRTLISIYIFVGWSLVGLPVWHNFPKMQEIYTALVPVGALVLFLIRLWCSHHLLLLQQIQTQLLQRRSYHQVRPLHSSIHHKTCRKNVCSDTLQVYTPMRTQ